MQQPSTPGQYLELVEQALFEVEDLLRCADEEGDDVHEFSTQLPIYQQIAAGLHELHHEVAAGTHTFADGQDLAFMPLVRQWKTRIPFHGLLEALNAAHRTGL